MGKAARNRNRRRSQSIPTSRPPSLFSPGTRTRGGTAEALEMVGELSSEIDVPCRATYLNDQLFTGKDRGYFPVADITDDGKFVPDVSDTFEPMPVILFEPTKMMGIEDLRTGTVHEARTEAIIASGFHRLPAAPVWATLPAEGWSLNRTTDGVLLRGPFDDIWAHGTVSLDPAWLSAAASYASVAVFYGPKLGIRLPRGKTPQSYTIDEQIAEFQEGRRQGLCTVASVGWHPVPAEETTNWVLLGPGAFGQPLPFAYVPERSFKPFGGPRAFGFVPLAENGSECTNVPVANGLTSHITATDFDLIRPGHDLDMSFVAGYHAPGGRTDSAFAIWRQAAESSGRVMVVTGNRSMPYPPQSDLDGAYAVLRSSHAATVPVDPAPLRRIPLTSFP